MGGKLGAKYTQRPKAIKAKARRMYARGVSITQIAKALGAQFSTVKYWVSPQLRKAISNAKKRERAEKPVVLAERAKRWQDENPIRYWASRTMNRVRSRGNIDLTLNYLESIYPQDGMCPVFKLPFIIRAGKKGHVPQSPSLDKIIPDLGYRIGNVAVISARANSIKNNANFVELRRVADWLEAETTALAV